MIVYMLYCNQRYPEIDNTYLVQFLHDIKIISFFLQEMQHIVQISGEDQVFKLMQIIIAICLDYMTLKEGLRFILILIRTIVVQM